MPPVTRSQQKTNSESEEQQENQLPPPTSVASSGSFYGFNEWEAAMDEAIQKEYERAARQRSQVKSKLLRINRMLVQSKPIGLAQLNVLSKSISAIYSEYSQLHTKIVGLVSDEAMEDQDTEYADFENLNYDTSNVIEALILAAEPVSKTQNTQPAPQVVIQQQPLKAPIPTFDGAYAAWPKFKAIFQDLMANSGDSDAIKLYHLDKALIGDAAGVLDTKVLSEGDYDNAWDILTDRFENRRVIVETHIRGLLSLKKIASESHKELRTLLNEATRHVESLRYLEQEMTGVSEHMVVYLIVSALDKSTRKAWEGTQKKGDLPKYSQTIDFLKSRCQILENCEVAFHSTTPTMKPKQIQSFPKNPPQKSHSVSTTVSQKCEICGGAHRNIQCSALNNLTPSQRNEKIRAAGVCFNCLRKGHRSRECPSDKTCRNCQHRHHTLLHDDGAQTL